MSFSTAELCERYASHVHLQIPEPLFRSYGHIHRFSGKITTLKVFEDNVLIRETIASPGHGRVLVIDGGGSHRCGVIDAAVAQLAVDQGWAGIIVYACIRQCTAIDGLPIGIRALHTHPMPAHQRGGGDRDLLISFAGVNFRHDHYVYVDEDGIVVSEEDLTKT